MTQKNLLQAAGDGTAVPAGYVGQVIEGTSAGLSLSNGASRAQTAAAVTLTPGVWLINGYGQYGTSVSTSVSRLNQIYYNITTSTEFGFNIMLDRSSNTGDSPRVSSHGYVITVTSNTNIGMSVSAAWSSGTINFTTTIQAVRIA